MEIRLRTEHGTQMNLIPLDNVSATRLTKDSETQNVSMMSTSFARKASVTYFRSLVCKFEDAQNSESKA